MPVDAPTRRPLRRAVGGVSAQHVYAERFHVPFYTQPGVVARLTRAEPRLSRRGARPSRYLVWSHAQDELVIACPMTD